LKFETYGGILLNFYVAFGGVAHDQFVFPLPSSETDQRNPHHVRNIKV